MDSFSNVTLALVDEVPRVFPLQYFVSFLHPLPITYQNLTCFQSQAAFNLVCQATQDSIPV